MVYRLLGLAIDHFPLLILLLSGAYPPPTFMACAVNAWGRWSASHLEVQLRNDRAPWDNPSWGRMAVACGNFLTPAELFAMTAFCVEVIMCSVTNVLFWKRHHINTNRSSLWSFFKKLNNSLILGIVLTLYFSTCLIYRSSPSFPYFPLPFGCLGIYEAFGWSGRGHSEWGNTSLSDLRSEKQPRRVV